MKNRNPWFYVPTLYFAEGLPYTVVMMMSAVYFKNLGADNVLIGMTSALQLPWILKFAIAPFIDYIGKKKYWIVVAQVVLSFLFGFLAATTLSKDPVNSAIMVMALIAIASATHDAAIDGYYLEALDKQEQAFFVGVRNTAFRLSMIFGNGLLVWLAGYLAGHGVAKQEAWLCVYSIIALSMGFSFIAHSWYLPVKDKTAVEARAREAGSEQAVLVGAAVSNPVESALNTAAGSGGAENTRAAILNSAGQSASSGTGDGIARSDHDLIKTAPPDSRRKANSINVKEYFNALFSYFQQKGIVSIILFILFFRLGDALVMKQIPPFLQDAAQKGGMALTLTDIGIVYGTVGVIFLLLGGIVGGILVSKQGLKRWLWPSTIVMNSAILLYWLLALMRPSIEWVYIVNSIEHFGYGLGMAAYTVFLLGTVKQEFKAAHYAVATALMALGLMLPGMASGFIYNTVGYANFFLLSFVASIPGMIIIAFLPLWREGQIEKSEA